jgi:hypothetical protein
MKASYTVMITGSEYIKELNQETIGSLNKIIDQCGSVLIGNYFGADRLVLQYLSEQKYETVQVFKCSHGFNFGYNVVDLGPYPAQDIHMRNSADYCLALWDSRSKGTKRNIEFFGKRCKTICY